MQRKKEGGRQNYREMWEFNMINMCTNTGAQWHEDHFKLGALAAWGRGIKQIPSFFSVNYDVVLPLVQSIVYAQFPVKFPVSKHVTMAHWNTVKRKRMKTKDQRYMKGVCVPYTCIHMHACTMHHALNAWLLCPQVNPLLCVLWSRVEMTNSGASAGESSHPQHTHLTTVRSFSPIFYKRQNASH